MLRIIRKFLIGVLGLLIFAVILLLATGNKYILTAGARTYLKGHNTANINDHAYFQTHTIEAGLVQPWAVSSASTEGSLPAELNDHLIANDAAAFLVIHEGQIVAEQYFQGYLPDSRTNSFSMAKTMVTMLLGMAIEDGIIEGLDQPITELLPAIDDDVWIRMGRTIL
jgi:CubicO group peptidase (beta-lactamase class C family)